MSRSRKHTPVTAVTTARSEKQDKVIAHRRERHRVRQTLDVAPDTDVLPHRRELSNVWTFAKDGKIYAASWLRLKDIRK